MLGIEAFPGKVSLCRIPNCSVFNNYKLAYSQSWLLTIVKKHERLECRVLKI